MDGLRRPFVSCRRVPVGLLLLTATATILGDACMADGHEVSNQPDDEILHEFVLVVLGTSPLTSCSCRLPPGCRTSLRVWHPHKIIEVLACGTFQSIAWLACMLVDQPCNSAWRLFRCSAAVAARLLQLKVRGRRLQAGMLLTV